MSDISNWGEIFGTEKPSDEVSMARHGGEQLGEFYSGLKAKGLDSDEAMELMDKIFETGR